MISVDRRGGLGNQLFQYAFGIGASARLGISFVMADDTLRELFTLGPYGRLPGRIRRSLAYRFERPFPVVKIDNSDFDSPAEVLARLEDRRHYAGFFQSEAFFAEAADRVRAAYTPLARHRAAFEQQYADLLGLPYVCCHVRRTDYAVWRGGAALLPMAYYADALAELGRSDAAVVFVGDDLEEARASFGDLPHVRFEMNDEITDLQLIARADAVVTSNSTFGWWGAWLGRPGRTVVAPKLWAGFREGREYPPAIIPPGWVQLLPEGP